MKLLKRHRPELVANPAAKVALHQADTAPEPTKTPYSGRTGRLAAKFGIMRKNPVPPAVQPSLPPVRDPGVIGKIKHMATTVGTSEGRIAHGMAALPSEAQGSTAAATNLHSVDCTPPNKLRSKVIHDNHTWPEYSKHYSRNINRGEAEVAAAEKAMRLEDAKRHAKANFNVTAAVAKSFLAAQAKEAEKAFRAANPGATPAQLQQAAATGRERAHGMLDAAAVSAEVRIRADVGLAWGQTASRKIQKQIDLARASAMTDAILVMDLPAVVEAAVGAVPDSSSVRTMIETPVDYQLREIPATDIAKRNATRLRVTWEAIETLGKAMSPAILTAARIAESDGAMVVAAKYGVNKKAFQMETNGARTADENAVRKLRTPGNFKIECREPRYFSIPGRRASTNTEREALAGALEAVKARAGLTEAETSLLAIHLSSVFSNPQSAAYRVTKEQEENRALAAGEPRPALSPATLARMALEQLSSINLLQSIGDPESVEPASNAGGWHLAADIDERMAGIGFEVLGKIQDPLTPAPDGSYPARAAMTPAQVDEQTRKSYLMRVYLRSASHVAELSGTANAPIDPASIYGSANLQSVIDHARTPPLGATAAERAACARAWPGRGGAEITFPAGGPHDLSLTEFALIGLQDDLHPDDCKPRNPDGTLGPPARSGVACCVEAVGNGYLEEGPDSDFDKANENLQHTFGRDVNRAIWGMDGINPDDGKIKRAYKKYVRASGKSFAYAMDKTVTDQRGRMVGKVRQIVGLDAQGVGHGVTLFNGMAEGRAMMDMFEHTRRAIRCAHAGVLVLPKGSDPKVPAGKANAGQRTPIATLMAPGNEAALRGLARAAIISANWGVVHQFKEGLSKSDDEILCIVRGYVDGLEGLAYDSPQIRTLREAIHGENSAHNVDDPTNPNNGCTVLTPELLRRWANDAGAPMQPPKGSVPPRDPGGPSIRSTSWAARNMAIIEGEEAAAAHVATEAASAVIRAFRADRPAPMAQEDLNELRLLRVEAHRLRREFEATDAGRALIGLDAAIRAEHDRFDAFDRNPENLESDARINQLITMYERFRTEGGASPEEMNLIYTQIRDRRELRAELMAERDRRIFNLDRSVRSNAALEEESHRLPDASQTRLRQLEDMFTAANAPAGMIAHQANWQAAGQQAGVAIQNGVRAAANAAMTTSVQSVIDAAVTAANAATAEGLQGTERMDQVRLAAYNAMEAETDTIAARFPDPELSTRLADLAGHVATDPDPNTTIDRIAASDRAVAALVADRRAQVPPPAVGNLLVEAGAALLDSIDPAAAASMRRATGDLAAVAAAFTEASTRAVPVQRAASVAVRAAARAASESAIEQITAAMDAAFTRNAMDVAGAVTAARTPELRTAAVTAGRAQQERVVNGLQARYDAAVDRTVTALTNSLNTNGSIEAAEEDARAEGVRAVYAIGTQAKKDAKEYVDTQPDWTQFEVGEHLVVNQLRPEGPGRTRREEEGGRAQPMNMAPVRDYSNESRIDPHAPAAVQARQRAALQRARDDFFEEMAGIVQYGELNQGEAYSNGGNIHGTTRNVSAVMTKWGSRFAAMSVGGIGASVALRLDLGLGRQKLATYNRGIVMGGQFIEAGDVTMKLRQLGAGGTLSLGEGVKGVFGGDAQKVWEHSEGSGTVISMPRPGKVNKDRDVSATNADIHRIMGKIAGNVEQGGFLGGEPDIQFEGLSRPGQPKHKDSVAMGLMQGYRRELSFGSYNTDQHDRRTGLSLNIGMSLVHDDDSPLKHLPEGFRLGIPGDGLLGLWTSGDTTYTQKYGWLKMNKTTTVNRFKASISGTVATGSGLMDMNLPGGAEGSAGVLAGNAISGAYDIFHGGSTVSSTELTHHGVPSNISWWVKSFHNPNSAEKYIETHFDRLAENKSALDIAAATAANGGVRPEPKVIRQIIQRNKIKMAKQAAERRKEQDPSGIVQILEEVTAQHEPIKYLACLKSTARAAGNAELADQAEYQYKVIHEDPDFRETRSQRVQYQLKHTDRAGIRNVGGFTGEEVNITFHQGLENV